MRSLAPKGGGKSNQGKSARYTNIKVLGRGAFGTAYLVRRKSDSFLYVMKKLALEQLGAKEKAEALNECAVLAKLRKHPNIVSVLEHFEDEGKLCIVMEYADGGDLAQRIEYQADAKSQFAEPQVLDWFVQICLALKHAHDRLILHRDLKPQNIFLTRKNFVRLGDFGISRVLTNTQSVASTCVGTPLYLAPELCEGKEYKEKGDIWSLGAILYELCVLQPPFTANTMPALVMRICNGEPKPVEGDFCEETKALALKLLLKNPDDRPRVHEILQMPFVKSRIEQFLDPDAIIDEFSHTVIREAPPGLNAETKGQMAPPAAGRPKSGISAAPPAAPKARTAKPGTPGGAAAGGVGATKRAPSRGSATATSGATAAGRSAGVRRPSPGAPEAPPPEETSAQRAQRLKEDEERRVAMREQMRRDRLAFAKTRGKSEPTAVEIVSQAVAEGQQQRQRPAATRQPAVVASVLQPVVTKAPSFLGVDESICRALEAAFPGTRLLTEDERRVSHDSLLKRQEEVVARVQSSQLKGEAGRAALNEAQRELLDISRIRAATSKRYVLLRTGGVGAHTPLPPLGTVVAGVPVEEIGHIDENDAEMDDEDDPDPEATDGEDVDAVDEGAAAAASGLAATVRLAGQADASRGIAWDCGFGTGTDAPLQATSVPDAERRHGGIKFDVTLNSNPKTSTKRAPPGRLAEPTSAPTPAGADVSGSVSTTLNVPAQLFGVGRPLSSKVEQLRAHLEKTLGSKDAFLRVYDYVSREESGAQQSGEREEILSFMADKRDLLPLVHTLLYLEEALDVRGA